MTVKHPGKDFYLERLCIEKGIRLTAPRKAIVQTLAKMTNHPNVAELHQAVCEVKPDVSPATLYRTVKLLESNGILKRHDFGNGRARYEPAAQGENHYHLINMEQGEVIEFFAENYEEQMRKIADNLGFDFISLRIEIFAKPKKKNR